MSELEMEQYLLDLQGYLVIEDVLTEDKIAVLNELIDRQELPDPEEKTRFGSAAGSQPECPGFLEWGKPFCDLLDHPKMMPILRFRLGECFRLDRIYGLHMREGMPRGKLHADYGATSPTSGARPGEYFHLGDNRSLKRFHRGVMEPGSVGSRFRRVLVHTRKPQKQFQIARRDI